MIRKVIRFCSQNINKQAVADNNNADYDDYVIPDLSKYKIPNPNIKQYTGYAYLNVEPFPRYKIAKICHLVLKKLKKCPSESNYRLFNEAYMKHLLAIVDKYEDHDKLEQVLATDCIEDYIQNLKLEVELVDDCLNEIKPWAESEDDKEDEDNGDWVYSAMNKVEEDALMKPIDYSEDNDGNNELVHT